MLRLLSCVHKAFYPNKERKILSRKITFTEIFPSAPLIYALNNYVSIVYQEVIDSFRAKFQDV